jgi:DNA-binding MarR family transcriptional regulator
MPIRLSILACLAQVEEADFSFVAKLVEISAPTCSKHLTVLEDAGYVTVRKGAVGRRPRTWLALTPAGRQALTEYLTALQAITGATLPTP